MKKNNIAIYRAMDCLRDAKKLAISLKANRNDNPLQIVVLDTLEARIDALEVLLSHELEKNICLDEAECWELLNAIFNKTCKYVIKIFNTLSYKLFLLRQNFNKGVI